jgi:hypothetical protein
MEEAADGAGKKPLYDRVEILVQKLLAASTPTESPKR